jgi:hypothetical protein
VAYCLLHVSSSGYCLWRKGGNSKRELENEALLLQIRLVHKKYKLRYGSLRITEELQGSENRIARLMRKNSIV